MRLSKKFLSVVMVLAIMITCICLSTANVFAEAGSEVYFDNTDFGWENVYVYAYGTKENAKWPGELMTKGSDGLYRAEFPITFTSENIIFNNGLEKDAGKEQYPENAGLPLKRSECKLLTYDKVWVDYGRLGSNGYGYAYMATDVTVDDDSIPVKLGLKNADAGEYSVDGSPRVPYRDGTVINLGKGKKAEVPINLELYVKDGAIETKETYVFKKNYYPTETTFSAKSDGHTTEAVDGYYKTNPNLQLGKNKTITIDGQTNDWDSSMIIAQGVANDDPRVFMPSSMHEQPWDGYALYSAWDDENLYFMWEMTNVTYIVSPSDNFAASNEARPWRNSIPMYLALSVDPTKSATGKAVGKDKSGNTYTNPFVWGCDGGTAKNGGTSFTTHVDTLIAMDTNNSNGGDSIFKADTQDTDGTYMFNYDTRIPIGVSSYEKQDNKNGFKIKYANGTKSTSIIGINSPKGSRVVGDNYAPGANWVDFMGYGYKASYGYIYEVAIPLSTLGIDKDYIETKGIGAMQILTYGTSAMDTLPHDPTTIDNASKPYSYDPSTTNEKEDIDNISVPLARVGALLSDTVVNEAPLEVNFGADLSSGQKANTQLTLSAEAYNNKGDMTYEFSVDGKVLQNSSKSSVQWTPSKDGVYSISVKVTDEKGNTVTDVKKYVVGTTSAVNKAGDVNGDGKIDVTDARLIQKYVTKIVTFTSSEVNAGDYNKDGKTNIKDVTGIQKFVAGIK